MRSEMEKNWRRDAGMGMRSLGDRRTSVRLEIVGNLWGTLHLAETARVVNISRGGALIMSPVAMAAEAAGPVRLTVDGQQVMLEAKVRHQRHVASDPNHPPHYLIGLEFPSMPAALAQSLE